MLRGGEALRKPSLDVPADEKGLPIGSCSRIILKKESRFEALRIGLCVTWRGRGEAILISSRLGKRLEEHVLSGGEEGKRGNRCLLSGWRNVTEGRGSFVATLGGGYEEPPPPKTETKRPPPPPPKKPKNPPPPPLTPQTGGRKKENTPPPKKKTTDPPPVSSDFLYCEGMETRC